MTPARRNIQSLETRQRCQNIASQRVGARETNPVAKIKHVFLKKTFRTAQNLDNGKKTTMHKVNTTVSNT